MAEPKTISQAIKPMLVLNFIFGLGVFECWRKKPRKIVEYVYTIFFFLFLYGTNRWLAPCFIEHIELSTITFCNATYKLLFFLNGSLVCLLVIMSRINAKKLQQVFSMIDDCDQTMENMGMAKRYRTLYKGQIISFSICGISIFIFSAGIYFWHIKSNSPMLTKLILISIIQAPLVLICICDISFCFWVNSYLRPKFKQLNEFLRDMFTTGDPLQHKNDVAPQADIANMNFRTLKNVQVRGNNKNAKTMRAVKQLHLELVRIANVLNSAYGMQILLLMTSSFIFVTGLLFQSYQLIWLELPTEVFLREICTTLGWIIVYATKMFYLSQLCVKASTEAATTGDIICELYDPSTSREFRAEIRDFTLQLIQNPLVFTACGFFDLDNTYLQRIIGTITTYLVILIQVGDMTSSHIKNSTIANKTENLTTISNSAGMV